MEYGIILKLHTMQQLVEEEGLLQYSTMEYGTILKQHMTQQLAAEAAWYDRLFAVSAVYTSGIGARTPQRRQ